MSEPTIPERYRCELATAPYEDCEAGRCSSKDDCTARAYAKGFEAGRAAARGEGMACLVAAPKAAPESLHETLAMYGTVSLFSRREYADRWVDRHADFQSESPNPYEIRPARLLVATTGEVPRDPRREARLWEGPGNGEKMSKPTFTIEHEPKTDMHPSYWWLVINGQRVTGCHSEREAGDHLDTAEQAFELGRAAGQANKRSGR